MGAAADARVVHLPYRVVPVCYACRAVEDTPVERAAHVPRYRVPVLVGAELQRVILIQGFDVDDGLGGCAAEVVEDLLVGVVTLVVPALAAVEVEPCVTVEPPRRGLPSRGVESDQVARVDTSYAARHGTYYGLLAVVVGVAVAAEDPYHVGILVTLGDETPVGFGVCARRR